MTIEEFATAFTLLFNSTKTYGKDMQVTMECYWHQFKRFDKKEFQKAVMRCIAKKDFPSVRELFDSIAEDSNQLLPVDIAESILWDLCGKSRYYDSNDILKKMKSFMGRTLSDEDKELILESVRSIGGFNRISKSSDEKYVGRRFREIYSSLVEKRNVQKYIDNIATNNPQSLGEVK